jgi:hypothetical protein
MMPMKKIIIVLVYLTVSSHKGVYLMVSERQLLAKLPPLIARMSSRQGVSQSNIVAVGKKKKKGGK